MSAQAILVLVLASHAFYVLMLVVRARLGNSNDRDFAFEGIMHGLSAYTALVWGPFSLLWQTLGAFVLDPLRLELKWGAFHEDETDNPREYKGRRMRRVAPRVSVGTYTRPVWVRDVDLAGTITNNLLEIGWRKFGVCVIRRGEPLADPVHEKDGASR